MFTTMKTQRKIPENRAHFYIAEISSAVAAMHSVSMVFRNVRMESVLFDSAGHIRLVDFANAKIITGTTTSFCGTPEYFAPEMLQKEAYDFAVYWRVDTILTILMYLPSLIPLYQVGSGYSSV